MLLTLALPALRGEGIGLALPRFFFGASPAVRGRHFFSRGANQGEHQRGGEAPLDHRVDEGGLCPTESFAGEVGNPPRVPITIARSYWTNAITGVGTIPIPSTSTANSTSTTPVASDG